LIVPFSETCGAPDLGNSARKINTAIGENLGYIRINSGSPQKTREEFDMGDKGGKNKDKNEKKKAKKKGDVAATKKEKNHKPTHV